MDPAPDASRSCAWCPGVEREMTVLHVQSGRRCGCQRRELFGQERETVEEAVAGDVVGLIGNDLFGIGDTLTEERGIVFNEIPRFAPECFAFLHNPQPSNFKQFRLGLDQLLLEGVVQLLDLGAMRAKVPLLAAVGPLQLEVVQYRLQWENNAESRSSPRVDDVPLDKTAIHDARSGRALAARPAQRLRRRDRPRQPARAAHDR